ncbi:MAG: hypothetical protein ABN479_03785 [Billgrantia sp.]
MNARLANTEIGPQRLCSKCNEWWPDDAEFFYQSNGKSRQPCKACYAELPSVIAKEERRRTALKSVRS